MTRARRRDRSLWLRWSWRDLRARWVQVAAIAFIIALGSGLYSGLSSTGAWRQVSYDASFAELHMYDLRVVLSQGSYVGANELVDTARSIPASGSLRAIEPRLIAPTQVDASFDHRTILVPGRLVGVDVASGGPRVNAISASRGRTLRADDAGSRRAVIDYHFAKRHGLPVPGQVRVSGDTTLTTVGQGLSPEYYLVTGDRGNLFAESSFAALFLPIEDVQDITGLPGQANDLVLTVRPGTDLTKVRAQMRAGIAGAFPDVGVEIQGRRGDDAYRILYDDIEGDQRFYDIFAFLILIGAAFAAFNLTGRIVESQRREIGVGMALGVPPARLAVRPLLVGVQIAALGALFGIGVGLAVGALMGGYLQDYFPLPVWRFPFDLGVFARGAALGLVLPIIATAIPVWRAVRVAPVDAIRTGYLSSRRRVPWLARIPLPGRTTAQLPFRNVLRAPRRTLMTVLGVAAAITVLIGVIGVVDSFRRTIDLAGEEIVKTAPRRTSVDLQTFLPEADPAVKAIAASPLVVDAQSQLALGGTVSHGNRSVDVFLRLLSLHGGMWSPTIEGETDSHGMPGIVLTDKAADDLRVGPGDTVTLRHPLRTGLASYGFVRSKVRVLGTNPIPTRFIAYMDSTAARVMGLEGITNVVVVDPQPEVSIARLKRSLFGQPGVASVQPVRDSTETIRKEIDRALGLLTIVEGAVLLLALLIAFNSASINADERARDYATMFAYGLPVRTVLRMAIVENAVIGVLATTTGVLVGWALLGWLVTSLIPQTFPDLGIVTYVSTRTLIVALGLGVLAVALAPVLTLRKLRRMDIPSTLRVLE
ncbi:MAG: FtsX-like permease family protein [Acidimicrobiia bacterium]